MDPISVNGVTLKSVEDVQAALKAGKINEAQAKAFTPLFQAKENDPAVETKVEHKEDQPLTEEQKAAKNDARQKELADIAAMKEKSKSASDAGRFATNTDTLAKQQEQYNTKEKAIEYFDLDGTRKERRAAKKIAKAANQNIESMKAFDSLEKVYTNKEEYKKAVAKAKDDGTWDKDNPKYTLLDGKALEGAKHLQQEAAKKTEAALKSYKMNEQIYNNAATPEDKAAAFEIMKQAATEINDNYLASQMFDKDGNVNTEAYQKAMLQYAGSDFKGNIDERKVLAKDADVKKRHTDNMLEAAGLDAEKDYTWAMRAGVLALGLGAGAGLPALLGGGATATAVANAVASATASATSSATATIDINIPNPGGGGYLGQVTTTVENTVTTTVTSTATDVATKSLGAGTRALNGLLGAAIPSIIAALAVKDNGGKDVFNGAAVMDVLENPDQVKGRQNKVLMNKIADMDITGDPVRDKTIKAAILTEAMSDKTGKKVNTRELTAAFAAASELKDHPELLKLNTTEATSTPETSTPATSTPETSTPATSTPEDCYNVQEKDIYKTIKVPQYRTGSYYISFGYVNEDGSNLSESDRRALQKELSKQENRIGEVRSNGRRTGIQMKDDIELPNGKKVKVADDAYARIMKQPAHGGGRDAKYNTERNGNRMRAVDCQTGKPLTGWMTPDAFADWEAKRNAK